MPNTPKLPSDVENILDLIREYGSNRESGGHDLAGYLTKVYIEESFKEVVDALITLKDNHKQELSTLKAQVRKEIEELRKPGICDGVTCYCEGEPEDDCEVFEYNEAIDGCLSIPSLKGEK